MCVFLPYSPVKAKRFTDAEKVAALMRVKESQRLALLVCYEHLLTMQR